MQEQKRLQITGISALLPPSVSPDGECSHVVNLRCRDDVWRPVGTPSCCYTPADPSHRLIFVHVNESYKHFFTYDDSFLYYEAQETDGEIVPLERPESFELTGVKRMEAVGNALIAFAEDSMHYLFYIDGSYRLLGTRPEFPEISFSLGEKTIREELWSDYALVSPTSDDASFTLPITIRYASRLWCMVLIAGPKVPCSMTVIFLSRLWCAMHCVFMTTVISIRRRRCCCAVPTLCLSIIIWLRCAG